MDGGRAVLDASVAVRWLVEEPGGIDPIELVRSSTRWVAPRQSVSEAAGALARKVQLEVLAAGAAKDALMTLLRFISAGFIELVADEEHVEEALRMSIELRRPAADCLYLAVARDCGLPLATADDKLARVARREHVSVTFLSAG
jgi:predicted nucleic acid-binding protein